jgi:L-asparaginase
MERSKLGLRPMTMERFSRLFLSMPGLTESQLPSFDLQASTLLLDSARMKPRDWVCVATEIAKSYSRFDGFLLIMGTDTMPYAASALSFLLENIGKPVIITGGQYPLTDARLDEQANLIGAMKTLEQADGLFEVAIFFNRKLIRGNRSVKVSTTSADGIASPRFPLLGRLEDGILSLRKDLTLPQPEASFQLRGDFRDLPQVSFLRIYPGFDPDILTCALREPVQGLIIETYGSGTAPDDPEFLAPLERASRRGVVIVSTTQCLDGRVDMGRYRAGYALRNAGVLSGGDMTAAAAYTKLIYLFACEYSTSKVQELMPISLRGELTPD